MKKLLTLSAVLSITVLSGCSTTKMEVLKEEAKTYSLTKSVYCGAESVAVYTEFDDFIAVSCADGSTKTIFLDD